MNDRLRKQFEFIDFASAVDFAEQIIFLGKAQGHQPVIRLERHTMIATVTWLTSEHSGFRNSDINMAQQTDCIFAGEEYSKLNTYK